MAENKDVVAYAWVGDQTLTLATRAEDKLFSVFTIDINTSDVSNEKSLIAEDLYFVTKKVVNGRLLLASSKSIKGLYDIYEYNIISGDLRILLKNPGNIHRWYSNSNGQINMALARSGTQETLLIRNSATVPFRALIHTDFKSQVIPIGNSGRDKPSFYALSNIGRDRMSVVELSEDSGKEIRTIYEHDSLDVTHAAYSNNLGQILFAELKTPRLQRYFFNEKSAILFKDLAARIGPDCDIKIIDEESKSGNLLILASSDVSPGTYYVYRKDVHELVPVSQSNPYLKKARLCPMQSFVFTSSDSMAIQCFLTTPAKRTKSKTFPLVVVPHGGPHESDEWGYNPQVQFLASKGYAVLQVNYRGSRGFGKKFLAAGFKEWGRNIQRDIREGVNYLVNKGQVDSSRVAILGNSFGGYCALYGLCFTPDIYKCGISRSGFVNLFSFMKYVPPQRNEVVHRYHEILGNPQSETEYFRSASPVFHSDKFKAPLMLVHNPERVEANGTEMSQFVRELRSNGVNLTYILEEQARRGYSSDEEIHFHQRLESFLSANL